MTHRQEKMTELLQHLAAEFLQRESNRVSLITVTGINISDRLDDATILVSVFPENKQYEALDFIRRKRTEFREYIKAHSKIGRIPRVDFDIDFGEKNRQRIEEISSSQ